MAVAPDARQRHGAGAGERPRVAVVAFKNPTGWWGRELGASAASQLTTKLVNSGAFNVLERDRVKDILDEWYLGQTGAVNVSQRCADWTAEGRRVSRHRRIQELQYQAQGRRHFEIPGTGTTSAAASTTATSAINVRVFSVTTGELIAASESTGNKRIGESVRRRNHELLVHQPEQSRGIRRSPRTRSARRSTRSRRTSSATQKFPTSAAPVPERRSLPAIVGAGARRLASTSTRDRTRG